MKIKDFLLPVSAAFFFTVALNYFFPYKAPAVVEKKQTAPVSTQVIRPLNREIDFQDTEKKQPEVVTQVETEDAVYAFSSWGASLRSLEQIRMVGGRRVHITTLVPPTVYEKEKSCFLIALDERTPYYYTLVSRQDAPDTTQLVYAVSGDGGRIEKKFTVHRAIARIDLEITLQPRGVQSLRVFFESPRVAHSTKSEQTAGVAQEASLVSYAVSRSKWELHNNYWMQPAIFGAEDRYFLHALYKDVNHFVDRAYYVLDPERLLAVLQGPQVSKDTTWGMSFYLGPKEHASLIRVDERLEQVIDYGWLGFLVRPLLVFMKWIYEYVYNYGIAIILLTLLMRLLLLPLTLRGQQQAERMKEVSKKIQYVKQKYKDDPQMLEHEQAEVYKKYGIMGLGGLGGGCLGLLVQIPIFFAVNKMLTLSVEMYQAPFLWISDLSMPDPLYIMPLCVLISMFIMAGRATDAQQRTSTFIMAVVLGVFSTGFPAGVSLYLAVSNILGGLQTYVQKEWGMS